MRRERQTEYQEYLKQKEGVKQQLKSGDISVQERRQQLAEERENELSRQSSRNSDNSRYRNYKSVGTYSQERRDPYDELRDRKRIKQKRYLMDDDDREFYQRKINMRQIDPVYRLEEERLMEELNNNRRRRRQRLFDNDLECKVHFDDIEDYDDNTDSSVMRRFRQSEQRDAHHNKDHNSQDRSDEFSTKSHRSNSAPLVAKGLMMLGGGESVDAQKKKKQRYAEELRQQIQQKEKEKKLEKLERFGFKIDSKSDHTNQHNVQDSSDKENHIPPQQEKSSHLLSPPKLRRNSRDYLPDGYYQGKPQLPLDHYDYYRPYPPAPQYYPPPMFTPYYQPGSHNYPLYHPMDQQSRRSRVSYDAQYDDHTHHTSQHHPVEVHVIDHDQHKMADQPKHDERSPESKAAYRDILRKQMEEKRAKDERAKLEQDRYDEKLRREIQEYDPWGKGGGGAPNQDNRGNIITDLRRMRKENETNMLSGSPSTSPRTANFVTFDSPTTKVGQRPVSEGKSQAQPNQSSQEAYKEALQQQIAEKERAKQLEKEKQRIEEEKELLRLEKQRIKLQEEYEKELAQQKAKEEDARRKNETMKREAEEKRLAALRRREEEELKEIKRRPPQKPPTPIPVVAPMEFRSNSPPVPALQNKMVNKLQDNSSQQLTVAPVPPSSPPVWNKPHIVPTDDSTQHAETSYTRASKAADERVDVLRQLSRMRQEFENEQKKIHRQLSSNSNTTSTSTTAIAVKPRRIAKDVFQKKPSAPLPSTSNTKDVSEQFNDLKYKRTSSRLSFMKKYPAPPKSESSLDIQQDALLRHQERDLAKLCSDYSEHSLNNNIPLGSSSLLASHEQHSKKSMFGDKSLLEGSATPLATQSKQLNNKVERPPSHAGGLSLSSIATLEVENIAARNEERMRRLDAILNSSKTDNSDPEAVIRKFLENRDHSVLLPAQKRRASEVSLEADTRMCPVHDSQ